MEVLEVGLSPRNVTSRRQIVYRRSAWAVHQFEVWSSERVCRVETLRMQESVLVWVGGGAGEPRLGEMAVAMPCAGGAVASELTAGVTEAACTAAALARRLAVSLARPVYVCCGAAFDRLSLPLVERGIIAEIKSRPECF